MQKYWSVEKLTPYKEKVATIIDQHKIDNQIQQHEMLQKINLYKIESKQSRKKKFDHDNKQLQLKSSQFYLNLPKERRQQIWEDNENLKSYRFSSRSSPFRTTAAQKLQ